MFDLVYFLGGSVDTELRRSLERELLTSYCEELRAAGVGNVSEDELWETTRRIPSWRACSQASAS